MDYLKILRENPNLAEEFDSGILERSTGSKFLEECLEVLISCGSLTIRSRQHKYREKTKYKVNCFHLVTMSKGLLIRRKDNAKSESDTKQTYLILLRCSLSYPQKIRIIHPLPYLQTYEIILQRRYILYPFLYYQ